MEFAVALSGVALLTLFYYAVKSDWPESYVSLRSELDLWFRGGALRYTFFRALPVYLGALLVAVVIERLDGSAVLGVGILAVVHFLISNGRAIGRLLLGREGVHRRGSLLFFHVATAWLIVGASFAGYLTRNVADNLVPMPDELVNGLWTAVFAATLAVAARRFTARTDGAEFDVGMIIADVGNDNWDYVEEAALRNDCDPILLRAIIACESRQRPRWLRTLENLKGKVIPRGTYGVAQMGADAPMSDRESIDRLADSFAGYFPERHPHYPGLLRDRVAARVELHNPAEMFSSQVLDAYESIQPIPIAVADTDGADGRSIVEVLEVVRRGQERRVKGTAKLRGGVCVARGWRLGGFKGRPSRFRSDCRSFEAIGRCISL